MALPVSFNASMCFAVYGIHVFRGSREGEAEKGRGKKSQCMVSQQFFSSSSPPPPQVKDIQARKAHPAPQPSAVPQELPGSAPTEAVSSSPAYPPHPPAIQHPAPSRMERQPVRGDLCFREARAENRMLEVSLYCVCTLCMQACSLRKTNISRHRYTSTSRYMGFLALVTDTVSVDTVTKTIPSQQPGSAN